MHVVGMVHEDRAEAGQQPWTPLSVLVAHIEEGGQEMGEAGGC